ncbi:MAG TPA: chorismate mutase [Candidatus Angelobacter sp.]|jgi:chorismate mutase|nr:chorismate mutase [Candidatus Angelobacter sp.]
MCTQVQGGFEVLQKRRKEIDLLDAELLRLLNERAQIVLELAAVKKCSGLPAYDGQREQEVLERICRENQGPLQAESVVTVFRAIIHEFRRIGEAAMRQLK